ncbi:MAG: Bro-N domain-containing protein [Lentisphaeria bacterium]|nr:Bro-N domain-containing protein [Lentisphaeria bacterium]
MSELAVFKFRNAFPVRVSGRNGEPWFVAADVCKAMAISNARDAISRLDDDEHTTVAFSDGRPGHGAQKINIVSESGLYALVIRSNKPEAREFRKWITAEVLPTIRRTGRYEAAAAVPAVREKPLAQTIAEMVRSLNVRLTAGEDVPAHILKYAWNMAGITRDLTLRHERNALFTAPQEFTLRETAPDAEAQIISALEERVTPLPGLPPVNSTAERVFIRTSALAEMLKSMPEEWHGKEAELLRRAAVFLPRVSQKIRRFPHHAAGPIKRKSGILWNENGTGQVRFVDLRNGELREIERG